MGEENPPTIWICNEAGHSYHRVKDLIPNGVLRPLTMGDINPLRVDRVAFHLARGITKFADQEDYLLLSGYQIINILAVLLWLLHFKRVKILQWNAKEKGYELTEKSLDDFKELLQREMERG